MKATVLDQLREAAAVLRGCEALVPAIEKAAALAVDTLRAGRTLFTAGNGGSAADALHLVEELTGRYRSNRRPLPGVCLAADVTALTCIANDFGYDEIFSRQIAALGRAGDLFLGFSTSGDSPNILRALAAARAHGVRTVLLSGKTGGKGAPLADLAIIVPSQNTGRIQEIHGFILHAILEAVEEAFPMEA